MKKVLFVATVTGHIIGFHIPYLKWFKEQGYEVHVASNGDEPIEYCDIHYNLPFERFPFKKNNLKVYKKLKKIINENNYQIIHCHTPVGGVLARLAAKEARKNGTRVIYTAHGFHFFKGAPVLNWILFYPIEKYLSKYTDTIITINKEDYELAKMKLKKCKDIQYVLGVGIDSDKFNHKMEQKEKEELRKSLGLRNNDFIMIYPAEISERKRQMWLIQSVQKLLKRHKDMHLLLPGKDSLKGKCQELVKELNLEHQIHFLGYRKDIPNLLSISNIAVSSSSQEGLPVNIMEAMYMKLPIVATNCRGNRDLVINDENGYLVNLKDKDKYSKCVEDLYINKNNLFGEKSYEIIKEYILDKVMIDMRKIYEM